MIKFKPRKIVKIQNTMWISLPIEWVRTLDIKKGEMINISTPQDINKLNIELRTRREDND